MNHGLGIHDHQPIKSLVAMVFIFRLWTSIGAQPRQRIAKNSYSEPITQYYCSIFRIIGDLLQLCIIMDNDLPRRPRIT